MICQSHWMWHFYTILCNLASQWSISFEHTEGFKKKQNQANHSMLFLKEKNVNIKVLPVLIKLPFVAPTSPSLRQQQPISTSSILFASVFFFSIAATESFFSIWCLITFHPKRKLTDYGMHEKKKNWAVWAKCVSEISLLNSKRFQLPRKVKAVFPLFSCALLQFTTQPDSEDDQTLRVRILCRGSTTVHLPCSLHHACEWGGQ